MSLNEIVNCPTEFASHQPYLVVQHIDWIQCRYLLVQVQGNADPGYGAPPNPAVPTFMYVSKILKHLN